MARSTLLTGFFACGIVLGLLFGITPTLQAQTAEELKAQVDATNEQIKKLQEEIAQLQKDLNATSAQKQTLQSAVKALDLQIQKLTKSISLTNTQITQKDKEIRGLSGDITTTAQKIGLSQGGVAQSLRELDQMDAQSSVAVLLAGGTLSAQFDAQATLGDLRNELRNKIEDLSKLKSNLQTTKTSAEGKRKELASLQSKLAQEKQGLSAARGEQTKLLDETKSKESTYQALIAQKEAQEKQFEQDLAKFEAQLGLRVDPGSVPAAGSGVLRWPVDAPMVTQFFGNTAFATANPGIYGGKGHNAIDLRASPGTAIRAARGGVIEGTGNTDLTCPNASYGKWVFIRHDNGLSTLYAHLSVINVSSGQEVVAGQVIGYSGSTGYATGPHLHFGVYATSGSGIKSFASQSCKGKTYTMPVADVKAYLNPLSYLPGL